MKNTFIKFRNWVLSKKVANSTEDKIQSIPSSNNALVLSGGGVRAAYQVGALKAISEAKNIEFNVVIGSSIGALNGLILSACLKEGLPYSVNILQNVWNRRTYRNTFAGHPSRAFFRTVSMALSQWMEPGPKQTFKAIFDPAPLKKEIDEIITRHGGLRPENRDPKLHSVAVMTTIEGEERKPLLLLSSSRNLSEELMIGATFAVNNISALTAQHGFASAALPSILPPVQIDSGIHLVDGGISQNVPVDPAVRLGGENVTVIDVSGRDWWHDQSGEPHDTRPTWEVPASLFTHCATPNIITVLKCQGSLGPLLKQSVGNSTSKFIKSTGPIWPLFQLLKRKIGEDIAYEVASYLALDPEYMEGLIEAGYQETKARL
jgi:predicted acylesterase/phospholipase RssA